MSKKTVRNALALKTTQKKAIAASLALSMKALYEATIRAHLLRTGQPDQRDLDVDDPTVLATLASFAAARADDIISASNRLLDAALGDISDVLDDAGVLDALSDFYTAVDAYNASTLAPYISRFAQNRATEDFYVNNGLAEGLLWQILPASTPSTDTCLDAIAAGVMTWEEVQPYIGIWPLHQNCPHEAYPIFTTVAMPDEVWTGHTPYDAAEAA